MTLKWIVQVLALLAAVYPVHSCSSSSHSASQSPPSYPGPVSNINFELQGVPFRVEFLFERTEIEIGDISCVQDLEINPTDPEPACSVHDFGFDGGTGDYNRTLVILADPILGDAQVTSIRISNHLGGVSLFLYGSNGSEYFVNGEVLEGAKLKLRKLNSS